MADQRFRGNDKDPQRAPREAEERSALGDRIHQDRQRYIDILEGVLNEALPDLPPIEGYHVCWLSTTNKYDTIQKRVRLGYVPVEAKDVGENFQHLSLKGTEHTGMIGWNEMVAYKIPMDKYQMIMAYLHHQKPMEDERMITEALEGLTDGAGRPLVRDVGEGTKQMEHRREIPAPQFEG